MLPKEAARRARGDLLLSTGNRLLAFAAHPDDLEYYIGGSLAAYAARGGRVTAVLATDGDRGGRRLALGKLRRKEQEQAAEILGYSEVRFLGLPDRGLRHLPVRLREEVGTIMAECPADLVLTFDGSKPMPPYVHPDHVAIGLAILAVLGHLEEAPDLYLFHTRSPDTVIDVSDFWDLKLGALRQYRSQARGEQLPRAARPLWRAFSGDVGFPAIPRREKFRRVFKAEIHKHGQI